jgi:lipopolysaccharide/colanic/teichoic acid biosynthesis glycosyltransferase
VSGSLGAVGPSLPPSAKSGRIGLRPDPRIRPREETGTWDDGIDRTLAALGLLVASPLLLGVALMVKIDCPGAPVIYTQERVGVNRRRRGIAPGMDRRQGQGEGRPFRIHKFRTMVPDAEAATGPVWAAEDDPRITPTGRFLRKTRLDELPQLWNVLRGEMRLVGPRPERPYFVDQLSEKVPGYRERLEVPPGITGLAQVEREYDSDVEDVRKKLGYDLYYIRNRRPSFDLRILAKTILVVLGRRVAR